MIVFKKKKCSYILILMCRIMAVIIWTFQEDHVESQIDFHGTSCDLCVNFDVALHGEFRSFEDIQYSLIRLCFFDMIHVASDFGPSQDPCFFLIVLELHALCFSSSQELLHKLRFFICTLFCFQVMDRYVDPLVGNLKNMPGCHKFKEGKKIRS